MPRRDATCMITSDSSAPDKVFQVVIIGSGFAGLGMAIQLARSGINNFIVLEKAAALGGTWRDNSYPRRVLRRANPPLLISFEMNREWRYVYAPQKDILEYLNRCADKYRIRSRMRFNQEVTQARFDEEAGVWHLTSATADAWPRASLSLLSVSSTYRTIRQSKTCRRFRGPRFTLLAGITPTTSPEKRSRSWEQVRAQSSLSQS